MGTRKTVVLLASMAAAVVLASMVAMATTQNTARAAFPGTNAKIVFARDPDGLGGPKDSEIYTIWFNGNNPTPLTNNTKADTAPSWSADGKKIVFERGSNLYTMSANGSNQKKVPNSTFGSYNGGRLVSYGGNPAFSRNLPCGNKKIIFDSGSNIFTINVDGTNRTRITNALAGDPYEDKPDFANPVWSPVSNKIAFSYFFGAPRIHVLPLSDLMGEQYFGDGPAPSQVTPFWSYRPDWSPDGSQIAFECYYTDCYDNTAPHSVNPEIYKVNANGTGTPIRLTNDPATDTYPAFSPDVGPNGGKIVFASNRNGDYDLYIMNADGTDPHPLTTNSARDVLPDWQPVQ
jgi:Tol biopolymer transport system component